MLRSESRRSLPSAFQTVGPTTANARLPYVSSCIFGTTSRRRLAERRCCRSVTWRPACTARTGIVRRLADKSQSYRAWTWPDLPHRASAAQNYSNEWLAKNFFSLLLTRCRTKLERQRRPERRAGWRHFDRKNLCVASDHRRLSAEHITRLCTVFSVQRGVRYVKMPQKHMNTACVVDNISQWNVISWYKIRCKLLTRVCCWNKALMWMQFVNTWLFLQFALFVYAAIIYVTP